MNRQLLVVTRQAGSVDAFEPLLRPLRDHIWNYDIVAFDKSVEIWEKLGYDIRYDSLHTLSFTKYDLVLTGTSLNVSADSYFWEKSESIRIPSIGFVDSWVNYRERFSLSRNFDKTPTYIGVIDQFMYERMCELGAPIDKLVILGHPRFDKLIQTFNSTEGIEKKSDSNTAVKVIVFFTDPKETECSVNNIPNCIELIRFFLEEFKKILHSKQYNGYKIIIKPHPREKPDKYEEVIEESGLIGIAEISNIDSYQLLIQADVVIGVNTILLVDSSFVGIPVFSFQPNREFQQNDITDRNNIEVTYTWAETKKAILKIVNDKRKFKKKIKKNESNIEKFIAFINKL